MKSSSRAGKWEKWRDLLPAERRKLVCAVVLQRRPISIQDIARAALSVGPKTAMTKPIFKTVQRDVTFLIKAGNLEECWIIKKPSPFLEAMMERISAAERRSEVLKSIVLERAPITMRDLFATVQHEGLYAGLAKHAYERFRSDVQRLISRRIISADAVMITSRVMNRKIAAARQEALLQIVRKHGLSNSTTFSSLEVELFQTSGITATSWQIKKDFELLRARGMFARRRTDYSERDAEIFRLSAFRGLAEAAKQSGLSRSRCAQIRDQGWRVLRSKFRHGHDSALARAILIPCSVGVDYIWDLWKLSSYAYSRQELWVNKFDSYYYIALQGKTISHPDWQCDSLGDWPEGNLKFLSPRELSQLIDTLRSLRPLQ